jgi:hypothetical protein
MRWRPKRETSELNAASPLAAPHFQQLANAGAIPTNFSLAGYKPGWDHLIDRRFNEGMAAFRRRH